jgi:zinc/manganese transport system permease protein
MLDPFLEFAFMRRALVGCLALAVAAPPLGVLLVLRRTSLTAEVLAHGVTPGIAAGFLVAGLSVPAMSLGGLFAGLLVAVGAGALSRATGGREDAALTALYLIALALGVALVSLRGDAGDLTRMLFGQVLGVDDAALLLMAGVATITLPALALAWRALALEIFDTAFARAEGARGAAWHMLFLVLVVLNVLAAFQAMGTLMAVGLMMLPAVAARHWARELAGMTYAAVLIAALAAFAGLLLSYHADLPSGPALVLTAGLFWALSLIAGPVDSLLARFIRRPHLAG